MNKLRPDSSRYLLVVPEFPIPPKRKIHHDFFPIGLIKIGTYLKHARGKDVEIVFGKVSVEKTPDEIWITSLFTYWSKFVHDAVKYYHDLYPDARIVIGGVYASLMPEEIMKRTKSEVFTGIYELAEEWCNENGIDESLLKEEVDFQILHGMRGCFRKCEFCGTWKIEPEEIFDRDIAQRVKKNHVIFYDNNFLRNPNIKEILTELANVKINNRNVIYESQSGFDGRILNQEIANLLKKARFINPRIAWDNSYEDWSKIKKQIDLLVNAGYNSKDIYIFILYNWKYDFNLMEEKRLKCWEWQVQISDCRFRPLDQMFDYFDSKKRQTNRDYFIHPNWSDVEVKTFRKNVRRHNICIRHKFNFYSTRFERMRVSKEKSIEIRKLDKDMIRKNVPDAWFPDEFNAPVSRIRKIEDFLTDQTNHGTMEEIN